MAVHGVAGYAAGCRCEGCATAQREREKVIAQAERLRWASHRVQESAQVRRQREERAQAALLARQQSVKDAAEARQQARREESARRQRQRQEATLAAERRKAEDEAERHRQYQAAVSNSDYRWLLEDQRQTTKALRTHMANLLRHARQGISDELLLQQAQETHQLAEKHYTELADRTQKLTGAEDAGVLKNDKDAPALEPSGGEVSAEAVATLTADR